MSWPTYTCRKNPTVAPSRHAPLGHSRSRGATGMTARHKADRGSCEGLTATIAPNLDFLFTHHAHHCLLIFPPAVNIVNLVTAVSPNK